MRYDPALDVAPPPLGSWWKDRVTGRRYHVVSFRRSMGRFVVTVTLQEPGCGPLSELVLPFQSFRNEYVPAAPPPKDTG